MTTRWSTRDGQIGSGQVVALTGDTGYFTFFNPANVEMVVKVLNGCGVKTDGLTGAVQTYTNPQGVPFQPIQDTSAFATCP